MGKNWRDSTWLFFLTHQVFLSTPLPTFAPTSAIIRPSNKLLPCLPLVVGPHCFSGYCLMKDTRTSLFSSKSFQDSPLTILQSFNSFIRHINISLSRFNPDFLLSPLLHMLPRSHQNMNSSHMRKPPGSTTHLWLVRMKKRKTMPL